MVQYCTSQTALLRLPAHIRRIVQISLLAGFMHNAARNPYVQALDIRCAVLYPLRNLRAYSVFPVPLTAIYAQDIVVDMGAVSWKPSRIWQR